MFRPSLWQTIVAVPVAAVLLAGIAILAPMGVKWRQSSEGLWDLCADARLSAALAAVSGEVSFLKLAASSLAAADASLASASVNQSSYDQHGLARVFNALRGSGGRPINSLGFYMPFPRDGPLARVEWQLATGYSKYGCNEYVLVYSDATTHPSYDGYCTSYLGDVNWTTRVYHGTDWGMSATGKALVNGTISEQLKPAQVLEGKIMQTYNFAYRPDGNTTYAVVFAELFLDTLAETIRTMQFMNGLGVLYVVEVSNGGMIAANSNATGSVVDASGARLYYFNTTVKGVKETYTKALAAATNGDGKTSVGNWLVSAGIYAYAGNEWLVAVLAPKDEVFHDSNLQISLVAGLGAAGLVVIAIAWAVFVLFKVRKHLQILSRGDTAEVKGLLQNGGMVFNEIAAVAEGTGGVAMNQPAGKQ